MDGAGKQRGGLKENDNKKNSYTQNQKETAEIHRTFLGERLGEHNTHKSY